MHFDFGIVLAARRHARDLGVRAVGAVDDVQRERKSNRWNSDLSAVGTDGENEGIRARRISCRGVDFATVGKNSGDPGGLRMIRAN
jgi:hypothetical protein